MLEKFEGEKKKQYIYLATAVAIGIGALFLISTLTSSNNKKQIVKKEVPKIKIVDEKKVEEEPFKKVYGEKIGLLEEEIKELKKDIKIMQELLKEKQNKSPTVDITGNFNPIKNREETVKGPKIINPGEQPLPSPNINQSNNYPPSPPPASQPKQISVKVMDNLIAVQGDLGSQQKEDTQVFEQNSKTKDKTKKQSKKTVKNTIPSGSFVRAVLLSGLDAPTSGSAVRSPHPVLLKLINKAILPNKWKVNIKDCFVIGSGYGDLSSERAYIRLERLSCTKNDGNIISKTVEGYVAGEDGKNGLKGRVVSKQGALLARTLIAGFLQGVSQAFNYSSQNLLLSPQGAVQTVNPNNALQYAGINGVSEATKKLADFYMNLVNKTFPVIEILPGRKVDIVFLKDVKLEEN